MALFIFILLARISIRITMFDDPELWPMYALKNSILGKVYISPSNHHYIVNVSPQTTNCVNVHPKLPKYVNIPPKDNK